MKKFYLFLSVLFVTAWVSAQVKSEIKITTSKEYGNNLDIWPKSTSESDTIFIDWGDGEQKKYNIDPAGMPYFTKVSGKIVGDTIRIFTRLVSLDCSNANITSLEIIDQPLLVNLDAHGNTLTSENCYLEGASNLEIISLSKNNLTLLDLRSFSKLQSFTANENERLSTVLFTDGNEVLNSISMAECDISHFYPISLPALEFLNLSEGSLMDLELADFYPSLEALNISGNYISEIDVALCPKLYSLNCSSNQLKKINVTQNAELVTLFCGNNQIEELNLSNNPKITSLGCGDNLLTSLDVSKLPMLTSLTCDGNKLRRLDLSKNSFLAKLYCKKNLLDFLDFAENPRMDYVDCRNNANMTPCTINYMFSTMLSRSRDSYNPNLLIEGCNAEKANTDEINSAEMKWMTDVKGDGTAVCDSVVVTMTPVENGKYHLEQPSLYGKDYKEVSGKVMAGTPVKVVAVPDTDYVYEGVTLNGAFVADTLFVVKEASSIALHFKSTRVPFIKLNVANGTEMSFNLMAPEEKTEVKINWGDGVEMSYIIGTKPTRIDGYSAGTLVTITGELINADFASYPGMLWDNQISGIEISDNNNLCSLSTYMNPVKKLIVGHCPNLQYLDCAYSELDELEVASNTQLVELLCYGNNLTRLDVSKCTELEVLDARNNQLTELDLATNTKLTKLDLQNNQLTKIDVALMPALSDLSISNNKIDQIDVSSNPELIALRVSGNGLTALDVSKNLNLGRLLCANNKLTALDLSYQKRLYYLDCGGNGMTACAMNDLYYSLNEYPVLDEPLKGYTLWSRGEDGSAFNDAEHAESLIAIGKGWLVNYEGDGTGCDESYITIKESPNGNIRLFDSNRNEVLSGDKVKKNTVVTVKANPAEKYKVESVKANGKVIINNEFTVLRATDVVAKFTEASAVGSQEEEMVTVTGGKHTIIIETSVTAEVDIYTTAGTPVRNITVSKRSVVDLATGMYIAIVRAGKIQISNTVIVY